MLNLTPLEREILDHRLAVPDAIADGLAGEYPDDAVGAVCGLLAAGDYAGAVEVSRTVTYAVLRDAVDGSTYAATVADAVDNHEATPQRYAAVCRAGRSLAEKVGRLTGERVRFPEQ